VSLLSDRRLDVDRVRHLAARAPRDAAAVAAVRRQPDSAYSRHRAGARRAGRPRSRLRRYEFPRLLRHLHRQRLLPRLRQYIHSHTGVIDVLPW